ncbi:hypothetical protein ACIQXI_10375 [Lysinibacillus sp. NPDC097195]|uniref:hypothetical protein n=1 Tax=Lysinibacillus sp. NPDC097195 TaxID=3364141 RepID=UPI0038043B64
MQQFLHNDKGLSLVEVIASIILISIILLSFVALFLQSNKTTVTSNDIVDATYVAQQEMETIYTNRTEPTVEAVMEKMPQYMKITENTWKKELSNTVNIQLTMVADNNYAALNLTTVIIEVFENNVLKSRFENRYNIGG